MQFLLVCSQKWGKTRLLNPQHQPQAADESGRLVAASWLPIPCPKPMAFPGPVLSKGYEEIWACCQRAVPGSGKPGASAALGKFRFPASAAGFRSCHSSRDPAGWLVTGAGFHPFKRLQI